MSMSVSLSVYYALFTNTGSKYTLRIHLLRLVIPDAFHDSGGARRGSAQASFVYTHPFSSDPQTGSPLLLAAQTQLPTASGLHPSVSTNAQPGERECEVAAREVGS